MRPAGSNRLGGPGPGLHSPGIKSKADYVLMNLEVGFPLPDSTLDIIEELPGEAPKTIQDLMRIIEEEEGAPGEGIAPRGGLNGP
jgi:hypothetical protein